MNAFKIAYDIINSRHGWSVAEQFEDTYSKGQSFDEQNDNALKYILDELQQISKSNVLNADAMADLEYYMENLKKYLRDIKKLLEHIKLMGSKILDDSKIN
jgi:hypothetical protein